MDKIAATAVGSPTWVLAVESFAVANKDTAEFQGSHKGAAMCFKTPLHQIDVSLLTSKLAEASVAIYASLMATKIMMRERRDIDIVLTTEAFGVFLRFASRPFEVTTDIPTNAIQLEAIRCMVNSVYMRPDFVNQLLANKSYDAFFALSSTAQSVEFHTLLWKCILASFEQPLAVTAAITSLRVYATILPTAAYCITSPGFSQDAAQIALVVELVKAMFVIANHHKSAAVAADWPAVDDTMPLFIALLQLPNTAQVFDLKLQAVNCLMVLHHPAYIEHMVSHGASGALLAFLAYVLFKIRLEKTKKAQVATPLIIGLNLLASAHDGFRSECELSIFGSTVCSCIGEMTTGTESLPLAPEDKAGAISMAPPPSAKYSVQEGLVSFMTSLDTDLKRCASEFLFTLCHQNPLEFTQRTGMGNAVALLRTRGLV
ncbi:hypothetical protein ACHHYP_03075 [Achlya hypogyna]|uniref:Uncharacterized protein n=1 Tax=Achlya hypogyna TaxID=1202772 RepID=A0A1V9Z4Z8_ACHHY|nr:hypothetical protein ACHHYP_03075 [Achlya hypogyna]